MRSLHVALISLLPSASGTSWLDEGGHVGRFLETSGPSKSVFKAGNSSQGETEPKSKSQSESESEPQGKTQTESKSRSESQSESESKGKKTESQAADESKGETSKSKSQAESKSQSETKSEGETESTGETESKSRSESKSQSESETEKTKSQSKIRSRGETESQPESESNGKIESKNETQTESKRQTESRAEDESKGEHKSKGETKSEDESKGESESKVDEKSEGESESKVDGGSEGNFTMPDLYDSNGWHFKKDWVSKIIMPQSLQPYYMMPLFFGAKTMFTLLIFGYSLNFKAKSASNSCFAQIKDAMTLVAKNLASLAFIVLAVNGYYCDLDKYHRHAQQCTDNWHRFGIFVMVAFTSPNYVAAVAIWTSLRAESPMTLLRMKQTRYTAIQGCAQFGFDGIPIVPGSTKWIPCMKHVYAIVLWPYYLPTVLAGLGYLWACCTIRGPCVFICSILWGYIKGTSALVCALYTTVFTLGLWKWPRDTFLYQFWLDFPMLQVCFLQLWAMAVVPFIMSFIFTVFLAVTSGCSFSVGEAFGRASQNIAKKVQINFMKSMPGLMPQPKSFNPDDVQEHNELLQAMQTIEMTEEERGKLLALNADNLKEDFADNLPSYSQLGTSEASVGLEATKISIFGVIIVDMATIVVEQAGAIFAIRAVLGASTYEEFISAAAITMHERHAQTYYHHVLHLAELSRYHAANAIWTLL